MKNLNLNYFQQVVLLICDLILLTLQNDLKFI